VVGKATPFHCTVDPGRNPDPFTASVNAGPPAVAEFGLKPWTISAWEPLTISTTGTLSPLLEAPFELSVIVPLYIPGASISIAAGFKITPRLAGVTPSSDGVTVNQLPPLEVFKDT
jgi:hypothetical protein